MTVAKMGVEAVLLGYRTKPLEFSGERRFEHGKGE